MEGLEHSPEHWESRSPPHTYLCLPSQLVNSILLLSCIQPGGWEGGTGCRLPGEPGRGSSDHGARLGGGNKS